MPFGVMSGFSLGMGVLNGGGDRRRARGSFGREYGTTTVTNGDGDGLFPYYFRDWGGLVIFKGKRVLTSFNVFLPTFGTTMDRACDYQKSPQGYVIGGSR